MDKSCTRVPLAFIGRVSGRVSLRPTVCWWRRPDSVRLPDGRILAVDDVGDPTGLPVVYLHGTPDSRLARHPDDGLAAAAGVRLVAVDRPGCGASDHDPAGTLGSFGVDLGHVLDDLDIERAVVLGWSAGGLFALAAASGLGERVLAVRLVGTVPPVEAYADPRRASLPSARPAEPSSSWPADLDPEELAAEMAPYLVPDPLDAVTALDHVLEAAGERGRAELAAVAGAADRLADLARGLRGGGSGRPGARARRPARARAGPGPGDRARCAPSTAWTTACHPPRWGAGWPRGWPRRVLEVVPDAGHHLLLPRWSAVLAGIAAEAADWNVQGRGDG